MQIGALRHRITFQQPVQARNDRKEMITTWEDWKTVWASIMPEDGREFYRAKLENAEIHGLIGIRYLPGVERTMRIKFGDRVFDIIWIRDRQERRREMRIAYKEAK